MRGRGSTRRCWRAPRRSAAGFVVHLAHRLHGEFRLRDEVSRLAIESIALGMLAEASRRVARAAERPTPAWLQQARALVEDHFAEPLPLASVAQRVGVHPVHLARTFRRFYQTTFAGYVRQVRIEFARRELAASSVVAERHRRRRRLLRSESLLAPLQAVHRRHARRIPPRPPPRFAI